MNRRVLGSLLLVALALGAPGRQASGQTTTGRIEGRVVDAKGQPVPAANVVASGPALQGSRGTLTDDAGRFVLLALAVGDYGLRVTHLAYQPRVIAGVHVLLGQTTALGPIRLEDRVVELEEFVVSGRAALVDPASTTLGQDLSARDYQSLPLDRDYKSVATLLPHAMASPLGDPVNFAGSTGLENRFFVDGIDVTDPYRNSTATNLPYNFVQEVQVRTGGYEAEYRSSLGGTVNVVTYSGGNETTAQAFGFLTGNAFSATPRAVPDTPQRNQHYSLYDVGFGVGGPIRKDRLWYYAAYNPSFSREDLTLPGWGEYEDHATTHSFAAKLTWRADDRNSFVLTSLGDPTSGRQVTPPLVRPAGVDPFLFHVERGGVSAILEGRHLPNDHLLLETSVSRLHRREVSRPETAVGGSLPNFTDSAGVVSGGGSTSDDRSAVTAASVRATWLEGGHEVKAGVEYRDTRLDFDNHYDMVVQSSAVLYYYQTARFKGHVGSRDPSAFLQHTWHPTRRLTINDGIRWSGEYWISSEGQVAQSILDEWQPRIGVTYQPGRLGTQKVYASFGRFYQDLTTAPLFWYYNTDSYFFGANYDHDPRTDPAGAETTGVVTGSIQRRLVGLQGQCFDELTVGYERQLGTRAKLVARGIQRRLRQGLEDGVDPATFTVGLANPGLGALVAFPPMTRTYTALELSVQGATRRGLSYLASYVLSRNYGDYEGLFDSRLNNPYPNTTGLYDMIQQMPNSTGLLPNDHTHVLKLSGSWRAPRGLTLGAMGSVQSGMPVSEFGGTTAGPIYGGFIGPRGSHGRTPAVWDLNLRLAYEPPAARVGGFHPRITVDVLHVASQRKPLRYNEVHYLGVDDEGNQIDPNPNYRMPMAFQPPMAVRLGIETAL
jgi:hypothetical protein